MANYNLISKSQFNPFSFEELLKPALMATTAHQALENEYAELNTKASVWEKLANDERDRYSKAYKKYKSYSEDLKSMADELASNGLNASSRQKALGMKSRYSSDITPIEEAYVKRAKDAEKQAENMTSKGIIYDTLASQTSLDKYIENPTLTYKSANINEGYKRVEDAAKALSRKLRGYGPGRKYDDFTGTFLKEHGYRDSEANKAIADIKAALRGEDNIKGRGILQSILDQEMEVSGVNTWGNERAKIDYFNRVSPAIYNAVGQTDVSTIDNFEARERERRKGKEKPEEPSFLGPRISEGVSGEVNKDLRTLEGLRPISNNMYSTKALDKKKLEYNKAQKEYDTFMKSHNSKDFETYEKSKELKRQEAEIKFGRNSIMSALTTSGPNGEPVGYGIYNTLREKLNESKKAYEEETKHLYDLEQKYYHLGSTPYQRMYIGSKLEDIQEKHQNTAFTLAVDNTKYDKVRSGISNMIAWNRKTLDKTKGEEYKPGNVGLVDSESGKLLGYDATQEIIKDYGSDAPSKGMKIKVKDDKDNPRLVLVSKGKEYEIKGVQQIDSFNNDLRTTLNYLRDFSANMKDNIAEVDAESLLKMQQEMKVPIETLKRLGNSKYGHIVLHDNTTGNYVKILTDLNGNIVATNSLAGELTGGSERDKVFVNMANRGLRTLPGFVAQ